MVVQYVCPVSTWKKVKLFPYLPIHTFEFLFYLLSSTSRSIRSYLKCIKRLDTTMTWLHLKPLRKLGQTTARRFGHAVGGAVGAARLVTPIPWYPHVNWQFNFNKYYLYL